MMYDRDFKTTQLPDFKKQIDVLLDKMLQKFYDNVEGAKYLLSNPNVDEDYYKRHIIEIIVRLRMKRTIDALTIHYFTKKDPFLAKKWAQYTDDEMLHDEMFGADLKRMGVSKDEIYSTEPMFSTKLLQGYFYYGLEHEGRPLASLCSSYFIETLSLKTQPAWLENVEKQKGLDAVKGHKSHIQHDIEDDHSSFVWNVVASFIKSDKDKEDVINHINNVFKLFCAFYTELYRKFITKNDSSISTGITI